MPVPGEQPRALYPNLEKLVLATLEISESSDAGSNKRDTSKY
jgi:hypothetical protein